MIYMYVDVPACNDIGPEPDPCIPSLPGTLQYNHTRTGTRTREKGRAEGVCAGIPEARSGSKSRSGHSSVINSSIRRVKDYF